MKENQYRWLSYLLLLLITPILVALIPCFLLWLLYEHTPYRKNLIYNTESSILSVLGRHGEISRNELRKLVTQELGSAFSYNAFFTAVIRLIKEDWIEERRESVTMTLGNESYESSLGYYKLTSGGRKIRKNRAATAWESFKGLAGNLPPGIVPA